MPSLSHLTVVIMFLALAGIVGISLPAVNYANQKKDRIIRKQSFLNEPVKITLIKTKKGVVEPERILSDSDDDWYKGLTVRVKNTSDKSLNYISLVVVIVRPKEQAAEGQIPFSEFLRYGVSPFQSQGQSSSEPVQPVPPGESTELTLSDKSYDENKVLLKKLGFPESIGHIELSVQEVGFEDGTVWSAGELWRRDPANPDKLIRLTRDGKRVSSSTQSNKIPPARNSAKFITANTVTKHLA